MTAVCCQCVRRRHRAPFRSWSLRPLKLLLLALAIAASSQAALPALLAGQGSGGIFLLLPVGARSVGTGEAIVADTMGADGAWWNPAALAAMSKSELAVYGSQTIVANGAGLTFAKPSRLLGTLAFSASVLDFGDQSVTDEFSGVPIGTVSTRNWVAMVSYATSVGERLRLGLGYKYVRLAFTCSGLCGAVPQFIGTTSALDLGAQYVVPSKLPITLGATLRHLGPDLQVKDAEQADPLPRTWQVGASTRIPVTALDSAGASLDLLTDVLGSTAFADPSFRIGLVLGYEGRYFLRGGYTVLEGEGGGPSIGGSIYVSDGLAVEIARRFDGLSAQVGQPPTYVSLRFVF